MSLTKEAESLEAGTMALEIPEQRLALIHRVIVSDADYPKEYAVLVTDRRSIYVRQEKTRRSFVLRQEMKIGTALVTDVPLKILTNYERTGLDEIATGVSNLTVPHNSVVSLSMKADPLAHRKRDFFVWMVMKMQKEIFQVYNFEIKYRQTSCGELGVKFYAVPLGTYFKPRRLTQTRETILYEYAMDILGVYRSVLPDTIVYS